MLNLPSRYHHYALDVGNMCVMAMKNEHLERFCILSIRINYYYSIIIFASQISNKNSKSYCRKTWISNF